MYISFNVWLPVAGRIELKFLCYHRYIQKNSMVQHSIRVNFKLWMKFQFSIMSWWAMLFSMEFLIVISQQQLFNAIEQYPNECKQPFICSLLLLLSFWKWKILFIPKLKTNQLRCVLNSYWDTIEMITLFSHSNSPHDMAKEANRSIYFIPHTTTTTDTEAHSIYYFFLYVLFLNDI